MSIKKVYLNIIKKRKQGLLLCCLCNKQDLPWAMRPKLFDCMLNVPCLPMVTINPAFRNDLMSLITQAIAEWARSTGQEEFIIANYIQILERDKIPRIP